jgi:hypothetical protein
MKRTLFNFLFIAAISLLIFSSCSDDDEKVAVRYTIDVTVQYPDGYTDGSASDIEVKATNTQTGTSVSAKTNANGVAQFSLASGVYSFTVAQETEDFVFNGLLENTTIAEDKSLSITLHASAVSGGLVIKEIYYTGSPIEGKSTGYYQDSFTEIYNNSDEIIYLDNIGFGALDPAASNTPSPWVDENGNLLDRLPLYGYTFYFKGSGTDYPLQPRTSIVIAMDGINHKTDPAGNPESTVNMENADWELYVGDINGGKDADAPGVPNMEVLHATITTAFDALYSIFGPAMVIFSFPEGTDPAAFAADEANRSKKPGTSATTEYVMISKDNVIDIVECVNPDTNKRNKRVPADLDAGYTFIEAGTYCGKSVRRKVSQIIDGKVVYKDTNNSTEDFLQDQTPTPFVHPTTVD